MTPNEIMIKALKDKMLEIMSNILMRYIVETCGDAETKKTLRATEFMDSMLGKKPFSKEDTPFYERYQKEFDEADVLVKTINKLSSSAGGE